MNSATTTAPRRPASLIARKTRVEEGFVVTTVCDKHTCPQCEDHVAFAVAQATITGRVAHDRFAVHGATARPRA